VRGGATLASVDVDRVAYLVKELVVRLVTTEGRGFALSPSLDELEPLLDPAVFFRVNRQVIAHVQSIGRIHRLAKGKLSVELVPPTAEEIVVSQEKAGAFRDWLDR
jgi:two-component system LytT family response regulator